MDADGLRLVVPIVVLDAHQVGVGVVVEARPHSQHVVVGLTHGLHQLQGRIISVTRGALSHERGLTQAAGLSLIAAALWVATPNKMGWRRNDRLEKRSPT